LVKTEGLSTLTAYAVKTEVKMTDRPVNGDHPDYNPSPDNPDKDGKNRKMILAQRLNQAIKIQSNDLPPFRRRF
jgi:hypothetical protein